MKFKKEELSKYQNNPKYMMILPALTAIYDDFSHSASYKWHKIPGNLGTA